MFVRLRTEITQYLNEGANKLEITFLSPILYAQTRNQQYKDNFGYTVPPVCPRNVQHGDCHINFIRKMQCAFSWDWGPTFPTMGIVRDIELHVGSSMPALRDIIYTAQPLQKLAEFRETTNGHLAKACHSELSCPLYNWVIDTKLVFDAFNVSKEKYFFKFFLNDQPMNTLSGNVPSPFKIKKSGAKVTMSFSLRTALDQFLLPWFPNGANYGDSDNQYHLPNLHKLRVRIESLRGDEWQEKTIRIGLRNIELIEEDMLKGTSFYFKINDIPMYMRGTNYIPSTLNVGNEEEERYKIQSLLWEAKNASMNMIRVWGGGVYESDYFYDLADEYGILIWQDLMFAVALYPVDTNMLNLISQEIRYQITRLQRHPCIALWAANNENEAAIAQIWWPEVLIRIKQYKQDYMTLYAQTIQPLVQQLDSERLLLLSSPSNGRKSAELGWFFNPQDPSYGDVHFYNYESDCFNDHKYPNARFVSEYGFQAYPSIAELADSFSLTKLTWPIDESLENRQHAPYGNEQLVAQINYNFNWTTTDATGPQQFSKFVYLSQLIQALAIKLESERYLRNRENDWWSQNNLKNISSLTMGSLYWQLNDVWQAPTWSSIEFSGRYKVLHHYVKNFFKPVHVIGFIKKNQLGIALVNDALNDHRIQVAITVYNVFINKSVLFMESTFFVRKLNVRSEFIAYDQLLSIANCARPGDCLVRIQYQIKASSLASDLNSFDAEERFEAGMNHVVANTELEPMNEIQGENFVLLDLPKNMRILYSTLSVNMVDLGKSDDPDYAKIFGIEINTDRVALFIYLAFEPSFQVQGKFSENGFIQFESRKELVFYAKVDYSLEFLDRGLVIHKYN